MIIIPQHNQTILRRDMQLLTVEGDPFHYHRHLNFPVFLLLRLIDRHLSFAQAEKDVIRVVIHFLLIIKLIVNRHFLQLIAATIMNFPCLGLHQNIQLGPRPLINLAKLPSFTVEDFYAAFAQDEDRILKHQNARDNLLDGLLWKLRNVVLDCVGQRNFLDQVVL